MSGLGLPWVHHREADSTNERAKALANSGAPHGTLVTADEQTAGHGRQGRAWVGVPGTAVLMSVVVRDLGERHALLPLTAAVAVCEAAEACSGARCAIKWPNDVWIGGSKLAGILVEARPQAGWAVVGVGINVTTTIDDFPKGLHEIATSLAIEGSRIGQGSRDAVLSAFLEAFAALLRRDRDGILDEWRSRDALRGRQIAWDGGEGTADGIDHSGALLVETGRGKVALEAGEVHLRVDV